jgi:hypothetical protein
MGQLEESDAQHGSVGRLKVLIAQDGGWGPFEDLEAHAASIAGSKLEAHAAAIAGSKWHGACCPSLTTADEVSPSETAYRLLSSGSSRQTCGSLSSGAPAPRDLRTWSWGRTRSVQLPQHHS